MGHCPSRVWAWRAFFVSRPSGRVNVHDANDTPMAVTFLDRESSLSSNSGGTAEASASTPSQLLFLDIRALSASFQPSTTYQLIMNLCG